MTELVSPRPARAPTGATGEATTASAAGRLARRAAALGAVAGLLAASLAIAGSGANVRLYYYVPASKGGFPDWLRGPLAGLNLALSPGEAAVALLVMTGCYLVLLAVARAVPAWAAIAAIAALHLVFALAPPLFSADVFGYIDYARLGVLHDLNPYTHGAHAAPHDAITPFVRWKDIDTPYGPLFTISTYPLASLGVPTALWTLKGVTALASLAGVLLVGDVARRLGRPAAPAMLFVGANPMLLAYGVGGAHNDMLVMLAVVAAVWLALFARPRGAGAALALAAGMKASAGLALPFMLLGHRRPGRIALGAAVAGLALAALGVIAFGPHAIDFVHQIRIQQQLVASYSVPSVVGHALGVDGVTAGVRAVFTVGLVAAIAALARRAWRERSWLAETGWATLAILVATAWLNPWYIVWVLPLAAVAGSVRLRLATFAMFGFLVVTRVVHYI